MDGSKDNPIETLRISDRDRRKIVDVIEHQSRSTINDERRGLRVPVVSEGVVVTVTHADNSYVRYVVMPRNLSTRGFAFVHGRFIYGESPCEVLLPMLDGSRCRLLGKVLNCRHVSGMIHEVSVLFDDPIDLSQFVNLTPDQYRRTVTELAELKQDGEDEKPAGEYSGEPILGSALVIDEYEANRQLLTLYLKKQGLTVYEANDLDTAERQISQHSMDLIVADVDPDHDDVEAMLRRFRAAGYSGAVLGVTNEDGDRIRAEALAQGCNAILPRPFHPQQLYELVEHLVSTRTPGVWSPDPIFSSLSGQPDMRELIESFTKQVQRDAAELERLATTGQTEQIIRICRRLKGAGTGYGFDGVTSVAQLVLSRIHEGEADVDQIRRSVDELANMLRRVTV